MPRRRAASHPPAPFTHAGSSLLRILISAVTVLGGASVALWSETLHSPHSRLPSDLGLSFVVAGVAGLFREIFILRSETDELGEKIADLLYRKIEETPPMQSGLRAVAEVRKGYQGYYTWAVASTPQDLFFAGRSVLHRIDADFQERGLGSAASVLYRRLCEGSQVRILFLDPTTDIIGRLAVEENHPESALLHDLERSLCVCEQLAGMLAEHKGAFPRTARLNIRVYDDVPHFAFHEESKRIVVGFYFATALGEEQSAYEAIDDHTRDLFRNHFLTLFNRPTTREVLALSQRGPRFNAPLVEELRDYVRGRVESLESVG